MKVEWIDKGQEPKCAPDPNFPLGKDFDVSAGAEHTCSAQLPWPAKRCGWYYVECPICGTNALITTAGRPDDPRSVKVACKIASAATN